MKITALAFASFAMFATACGTDGLTVDLNGKTPEEQADAIAAAACSAVTECGIFEIETGFDPETEEITCTATAADGDVEECEMDYHDNSLPVFSDCELTDAQLDTIEDCFEALADLPCLTQAQADAYCDDIVAGEEDPQFGPEQPAVCDEMDEIIDGCQSPT